MPKIAHLREFVFANERHPESVRTVPWLRPAGGDSVPLDPADPLDPAPCSQLAGLEYGRRPFNLPQHNLKSIVSFGDYVRKNGLKNPILILNPCPKMPKIAQIGVEINRALGCNPATFFSCGNQSGARL